MPNPMSTPSAGSLFSRSWSWSIAKVWCVGRLGNKKERKKKKEKTNRKREKWDFTEIFLTKNTSADQQQQKE